MSQTENKFIITEFELEKLVRNNSVAQTGTLRDANDSLADQVEHLEDFEDGTKERAEDDSKILEDVKRCPAK